VAADGDEMSTEAPDTDHTRGSAEDLRHLISRSFIWMEALDRRALSTLTPPLTVPQAHALEALSEKPDQSLGDLAARLLTVKSNASGIVDRLQVLGLVERHEDPVDARRIRLHLTHTGIEALSHVNQARGAALARVIDSQGHDQVLALTDHLRHLIVVLQHVIEE
jgi:DNA-binding MarR family transcriptional regulator